MLERLRIALSKTDVDPNHSEADEIYVPFGVTDHFDPDYVPGPDDPGDFDEHTHVPDEEVQDQ